MRESNFDVFDPSTVVMDYESSSEDGCDHGDFGFAFNDPIFSDRLLHILIMFSKRFGSTQSPSVKLKTLHISSPILAARSSFFSKFFTNRTSDSQQRSVTLRINASEEAAFMELLKFMYSNNLTVTTAPALLGVLTVADKFEVASCIRHCSRLLRNLPMTPESVLIYLDLPSTVITSKAFEPLTVAAKQFYAVHFKDITKFKDEILGLPLAGVEAIIASDDLQVASEDAVYRFVLKWAQAQYSNETERCEIIRTRLAKYIRYPYMTRRKLLKLLTSKEFDRGFAQKVVTEAISFKAEVPDKQQTYIRDEKSVLNRWFVERAYKYRPIKMVEFEHPRPHCVVYLDLKHDVCARLFPSGTVMSEAFYLGGHRGQTFSLLAQCNMDSFGLYLGMKEMETGSFEFDYEFAASSKLAEEFVSKLKRNYTFKDRKAIGLRNMFAIPWRSFISEDSVYFIDGVLHLRVELTELIK